MPSTHTSITIGSGLKSQDINAYSDQGESRKKAFHRDGKLFLKQFAATLDLSPGSYEIRSNTAGIAVSGEVTLHSDRIYVQLFESSSPGVRILYRSCEGLKDYCGGHNNTLRIEQLESREGQDKFLTHCRQLLAKPSRVSARAVLC